MAGRITSSHGSWGAADAGMAAARRDRPRPSLAQREALPGEAPAPETCPKARR